MKVGTKKLIYKWVLVNYKELYVRWDKKSDGGAFNPKSTGGGIFTRPDTFFALVVTRAVFGGNDPIVN